MISLKFSKDILLKTNLLRAFSSSSQIRNSSKQEEQFIEYREPNKDRTQEIPLETSKRYLKSSAYKQTYGTDPVWVPYRRNHRGSIPPKKTRKTCVRAGIIATGNPCPICRDEYLVLHEENIELLQQFVCPHTGSILSYSKTGLCQKSHQKLIVAIERARNRGLLTFDVPFRQYDYSEYYKAANNQ